MATDCVKQIYPRVEAVKFTSGDLRRQSVPREQRSPFPCWLKCAFGFPARTLLSPPSTMSQGSQVPHCFATEEDMAKWLGESGRKWKQKVHGLSIEALRRMAVVLGVGKKGKPPKDKLAEIVCEKAASLLATAKKRGPPPPGQSTQSPMKKTRSSASASSAIAAATPEPAVKEARWAPGCQESPMTSADGPAAAEGPRTPRSLRAAEALAMSTRKSELGSPLGPEATPPGPPRCAFCL